jgi:hypothetical protein
MKIDLFDYSIIIDQQKLFQEDKLEPYNVYLS